MSTGELSVTPPANWKFRLLHPLLVFAAMLALYARTMPRTITLEDAGLFQMVCHLGGISHPPGYPLFTLLCNAAVQYPNAINGNLVSAVFGAMAVAVLHEVAFIIRRDRQFAYVASLAWGLTTTFWSQSIIIEVYTLAALVFMVCWWLTFTFEKTRDVRFWYALCFTYGLALSDHWPLTILSSLTIVATLWPALPDLLRRAKSPRFVAATLGCLLLGLIPYISLVINPDPKIAVFGGIHSVKGFIHYIARSEYSDSNPAAGIRDKLLYAEWLFRHMLWQLGPVALPFILLGIVESFRRLRMSVAVALVCLFLGSTYLLLMLLNFEYSPFFKATFRPYPIIAVAALAIWFALGVSTTAAFVGRFAESGRLLVAPAILLTGLFYNFPDMDRSHSHLVDDYMRTLLTSLPKDAVLFVQGDNDTGPIGFLHYVEGVRPDVEVREWNDLVFDNRLVSPFTSDDEQMEKNKAFVVASKRPVFTVEDDMSPHINYGGYFEVTPGGQDGYRFIPEFGALVDMLVDVYRDKLVTDLHEKHFVFQRLIQFSKQYVDYGLAHAGQPMPPEINRRLMELENIFPGKLITLQRLVPIQSKPGQKKVLIDLAAQAERQLPEFATPQSLAVFYELYGRIELLAPANPALAERYFRKSIEAYPIRENTSICRLKKLYAQTGQPGRMKQINPRLAGVKCDQ